MPGNRTAEGKFEKGTSGNPSGRPKALADLKEWLKTNRTKRQEKLTELMEHEDGRVRLEAIKHADAYDYGKPAQEIQHSGEIMTAPITINWKAKEK